MWYYTIVGVKYTCDFYIAPDGSTDKNCCQVKQYRLYAS